jgi:hypothetical protein
VPWGRDPRILVVHFKRLPHYGEIGILPLLHDRLPGLASEGQALSHSSNNQTCAFKILISNDKYKYSNPLSNNHNHEYNVIDNKNDAGITWMSL